VDSEKKNPLIKWKGKRNAEKYILFRHFLRYLNGSGGIMHKCGEGNVHKYTGTA